MPFSNLMGDTKMIYTFSFPMKLVATTLRSSIEDMVESAEGCWVITTDSELRGRLVWSMQHVLGSVLTMSVFPDKESADKCFHTHQILFYRHQRILPVLIDDNFVDQVMRGNYRSAFT